VDDKLDDLVRVRLDREDALGQLEDVLAGDDQLLLLLERRKLTLTPKGLSVPLRKTSFLLRIALCAGTRSSCGSAILHASFVSL